MSALKDALNSPAIPQPPKGWSAGVEFDGTTGEATSRPLAEGEELDHDAIISEAGLDPAEFAVSNFRFSRWDAQTPDGIEALKSWKFTFTRAAQADADPIEAFDLDEATDYVRQYRPLERRTLGAGLGEPVTEVVNLSDLQLFKSEGGGVDATIDRVLDGLDSEVTRIQDMRKRGVNIDELILVNNGDPIENIAGNYCVTATTPVLTDDLRWVPAGELSVGDGLYAINEESPDRAGRSWEKATVTAQRVEPASVVEVVLGNGDTITCTPEHPLLSKMPTSRYRGARNSHWVEARNLKPGDLVSKMLDVWGEEESKEAGWLAGMLDGEGCFSRIKERSSAQRLTVSQAPGPVLDRLKLALERFGFEYSPRANAASGVVNLNILGGYEEVLRLLGSIRPGRLIGKLGEPKACAMEWVEVVEVRDAGVQEIARMSTSSRTYVSAGYASHNSAQLYTVEGGLRAQLKLALELWQQYATTLFPMVDHAQFVSVLCNHGEFGRLGGAKSQTSDSDNAGGFLAEALKMILDAAGYSEVEWTIPHDEMNVYTRTQSDVLLGFNHGHKIPGNGPVGFEKWLNGQVRGDRQAWEADIWVTAHRHHFEAFDLGSAFAFACPSCDGGSKWLRDSTGKFARAGILSFIVDPDAPMQWRDAVIL